MHQKVFELKSTHFAGEFRCLCQSSNVLAAGVNVIDASSVHSSWGCQPAELHGFLIWYSRPLRFSRLIFLALPIAVIKERTVDVNLQFDDNFQPTWPADSTTPYQPTSRLCRLVDYAITVG